jgi:predicted TIM-barrel fold metal-dependent hydrolase
VLERLLDVFGPDRILYGSDSRHAAEGYRHGVLQEHLQILDALQVPDAVRRKILGGNMARQLRIDW